jgi:branched-subunit amino acid transport protein
MPTDLADPTIWLVIVAAGGGTLALRLSFILLFGRIDTVPPRVVGVLRFVPAAVLAALVAPAIVALSTAVGDPVGLAFDPAKVVAGAVAAVVAWRTESVLYTIGVGMGVLWTLTLLF